MKFSYVKSGNTQKPGSTFAKIERKETTYEVETTKVFEYSVGIPKHEQETVMIIDGEGTHVYSCEKSQVHQLLKRVSAKDSGWVINRIGVYNGQPIEVDMQHKDRRASARV